MKLNSAQVAEIPKLSFYGKGLTGRDLLHHLFVVPHQLQWRVFQGKILIEKKYQETIVTRMIPIHDLCAERDKSGRIVYREKPWIEYLKRHVSYEVPILVDGHKHWRKVTQMNRDAFVVAAEGLEPDYLEQVIQAYLDAGHGCSGQVGHAKALLFEMPHLVSFAVQWYENRFGGGS